MPSRTRYCGLLHQVLRVESIEVWLDEGLLSGEIHRFRA